MTHEEARIVLGVPPNASKTEITEAYKRLMRTVHPDICKGPEADRLAKQATHARDVLSEPHWAQNHRGARAADGTASEPQQRRGDATDDELARLVIMILQQRGAHVRADEIIDSVVELIQILNLTPEERSRASDRIATNDFWANGIDTGLWEIYGNEVVLSAETAEPHGTDDERAEASRAEEKANAEREDSAGNLAWGISVSLGCILAIWSWLTGELLDGIEEGAVFYVVFVTVIATVIFRATFFVTRPAVKWIAKVYGDNPKDPMPLTPRKLGWSLIATGSCIIAFAISAGWTGALGENTIVALFYIGVGLVVGSAEPFADHKANKQPPSGVRHHKRESTK